MEGEDSSGSGLYKPRMEAENQGGDGIAAASELLTIDECEPIDEMDDSQLVGVPVMVAEGSVAGGKGALAAVDVEVRAEVKVKETDGVKRKRGRPPRGQAKPPPLKKKREEEDVCFICFDGGSLVLCDRRGCPKAYHPACIKRDEAFFRSRAKWNCGWHICSICQKAAHYMCYTCTYSLCKACTKDADYLCARENKGFCTVCMRTIMLIENNDQGNKEMAQVDFDDKSSWEYLFKVYWIYLKGKLSLTLDELTQAKNPWKAAGTMACKGQSVHKSLHMHYGGNDGKGSVLDNPSGHLDANDSKRRRTKEQPKLPNNDSLSTGKSSSGRGTTSTRFTEWASKELLEFVVHVKNGDTSVLSQFDVQALLLDYIKRNNLRDPRRKSQIICDSRLKILFGKPRVGHFEMLKLLEFHFLMKEDSRKDVIQGNIVDAVLSQVEGGGNNENLLMGKDKKRKPRRKGEERGPQTNLDEYAAIDVHNINLIYLRRNLMGSLIADKGRFHDKVVGSIVRIRISNSDQKQDMYRLVQVVGTCKVAVPYKIGEKTTDVTLEILNLDKKESISIDLISNQDFSKDECRRLRQSIKCGLVKRLTVGQIQEKAMALQEVRLNDWLETEVLRLNHLRDRASEKGHKKELRECVEKLELLKTPEERQRRLHEIPEVHVDPNMDPNCESDGDAGEVSNKKQDEYVKPIYSGFSRNGDSSYDSGCRGRKKLTTSEQSRTMSTKFCMDKGAPSRVVERVNESSWHEGKDACGSNSSDKPGNHVDSSGSVVGGWNSQAVLRSGSFSGGTSETSIASLSTGSAPSANDSETDKLWHYRDPNGKIQGPFCMVQLRKWSTTGYFPPDMTIWSINDEEVDSFLLTDVLNGKFHKVLPLQYNISLPSQDVKVAYDSRLYYCDDRRSVSMNTTRIDGKQSDRGWNCGNAIAHTNVKDEFVKGDVWSSPSSNWTTAVVNNNDVRTGSSSRCWDSLKVNNSHSDQPQVHCQVSSSTFIKQQNETSLHQGSGLEGEGWNPGPNHGNWSSRGNTILQATNGQSHDNRSDSQGYSGQSPGESLRTLPANFSSNSSFASVAKSTDSSEQNLEIDIPNLPSPTPNTSNEDLEGQTTKDKQSVPSKVPVQDSGIQKLPSSPARNPSVGDLESQPTKDQQSVPLKIPVQDSGMQKLPGPTPKPSDGDEKADSTIQNLTNPPTKPMDGDNTDSTVQNLPSPPPKPMFGDEKADSSVQNLPSPPPKPMVGDEKVDSSVQNLRSPPPKPMFGDEKADSSVQNLPSPPPKQMLGDEKIDSSIQNLPSPPPKPMDVDEKVDSSIQNLSSPPPKPMDVDEKVDSSIQNLPSPSPKSSDGDEKVQATENKAPVSSNVPVQDSGPSWSSASSLVVGGGTLPETADEWGGYSPTCAKPSVKEWDSGLVSVASLNPPEVASDYAAAPTSNCDQLTRPSLSHPAINSSSWQAVVTEPFEFSTLAEESVSDLLAEVDAMESQCGLASATSVIDSDEELFQDSKNDCFTSIGRLSPPLDSGKSDALSSTGDIPLPYQSTITDEPLGASPANVLDPVKRSGGQSCTSAEVKVETQPTDISVNQSQADSSSQLPASSTFSRDMVHTNTAHRTGLKPMNTGWGTIQGNMNLGLGGGSTQGIPNVGWATGLGTARGNVNMNGSPSAGFMGWESQPRYGGERFIGPRDWAFQNGDSGFGRGRASWSRQSSYGYGGGGGGGGGNYSRPPPKGQRVCKFYESGHCKKGAFCDYLHP